MRIIYCMLFRLVNREIENKYLEPYRHNEKARNDLYERVRLAEEKKAKVSFISVLLVSFYTYCGFYVLFCFFLIC